MLLLCRYLSTRIVTLVRPTWGKPMKLTKEFRSRLDALKVAGLRKQYEKAYTILGELSTNVAVTQPYRPESRIPNCRKYELPDGYRIVFQIVEGGKSRIPHWPPTGASVGRFAATCCDKRGRKRALG